MITSTEFTAALPLWFSSSITLFGFIFGGLIMYLSFKLRDWMTPSESKDSREPLLPKSSGEDSEASTGISETCWQGDICPGDDADTKASTTASATVLCTTLLMALPSVMGTWCWPLLLAAMFPAAAGSIETDANREAFHHFTFGADVAIFAIIIYSVASTAYARSSRTMLTWMSRWGPLIMVSLGCLLLIIDPTRHVLLDHGGVFFKERTLAMYSNQGGLSPMGHFCQVASISGIVLLVTGVLWHIRLPEAVLAKAM